MKFPKLKGKAVLAPMAGVTDVAFRALAVKYGASLTYTEFISSTALVRGSEKTLGIIKKDKSENPCAVQIFGGDLKDMADAAKILEKKFDIIDINCGCPAVKVIKIGAGSILMKEPKKLAKILSTLTKEVKIPITIKIRAGVYGKKNAVEVAQAAEKAGASAITVHGRTLGQGYSGKADWDIIKKVKKAVGIPVIGNGDITSPEIAKQRLEESGVDYIMIGRAAMNNPYIFKQINDFLKKGSYTKKDSMEQFREYAVLAKKHKLDFQLIKEHAIRFTKGMPRGARTRDKISKCKSFEEVNSVIKSSALCPYQ
ncbi:tRNA dihydrouridine synthase DusB [Candidatus Woesearchaeota archaeon]|nr:tRNA dihydrouridine synthase DusB [Candidatus Woesearchaeota archaeon]